MKRVAIVTGASTGIGRACATALARTGFQVFGASRRARQSKRGLVQGLTLDVRDDTSVACCIDTVLSTAGRIDVLVNNAGVATVGALEETTFDEFKNVIDTNLLGTVRMMRAVLPVMRKQHSGRIVNIGSVMAFLPMPYSSAYCASKHALRGLSESVDHEVRSFGIRVIDIEPGFIRTGIAGRSPVAKAIPEYECARRFPVREFRRRINQGTDPSVVARAVVEAVTVPRPELRYLPDNFARLIGLARTLVPSAFFDMGVRSYFRLD
jgi:NAD(P)-dependent dehydrogenase (short-subunit alcohol dehydrogenase family)